MALNEHSVTVTGEMFVDNFENIAKVLKTFLGAEPNQEHE